MLSQSLNRSVVLSSFLALASILLVACASAGRPREASSCQLRGDDSTFAAGRTLYRDCAVDDRARLLTTNIRPDFSPAQTPGNSCYSADLEFVVDSTGAPEIAHARIARANNPQYGDALLATLPTWKYEPARIQGRPVRQLVIEHRSLVAATFAVPMGSAPPTRPPTPVPNC
jgi:hypothetical protein